MSKKVYLNENIKCNTVRCISKTGTQMGIIATSDALNSAYDSGLDLLLVSPDAEPPVAKIVDYNKMEFHKKKELKKQKTQSTNITKEIKVSARIAEHDVLYKLVQTIKFLKKGYSVKFKLMLRGREIVNPEIGTNVLKNIYKKIDSTMNINILEINQSTKFLIMIVYCE